MNPALLEQRKDALYYNKARGDLITDLCSPLGDYYDVGWFIRGALYLNGQGQCMGYRGLVTDINFLNLYLFQFDDDSSGRCFMQAMRETPLNSYSYFLWKNGDHCSLKQMLFQKCGLVRGLTIYKRCENHIDAWSFASRHSTGIPNSVSKVTISPFLDFIHYFGKKEDACNLLSPFIKYDLPFDLSYIEPDHHKKIDYKAFLGTNRYTLKIDERIIIFSKREWECLSKFAEGKTYKGVANILSLSSRTVESYLNQIKEKTGISSKAKLIDHFIEQNQSFFR